MKHNTNLTKRAQQLRKNMTYEEKTLWYQYLRDYKPQFRRQVTFGNYILDFYCAAAKLAIELDGSQHYEDIGLAKDAFRTKFLEENDVMVLRFANTDVKRNLYGVTEQIDLVVKERMHMVSLCDGLE